MNGVASLTGLVSLTLRIVDPPRKRWSTSEGHFETWRAATFLTGLTGLTSLILSNVLHAGHMEEDVRCIAALTKLESLGLHGKCSCHNRTGYSSPESSWLMELWWKGHGYEIGSKCPDIVWEFEQREGFSQLLSLRALKELLVSGPWVAIVQSSFREALNAFRREMGWPRLKIVDDHEEEDDD